MEEKFEKISEHQARYYGSLFEQYGPEVNAVASGKQIYKDLRYQKLSSVFEGDTSLM